MATDGIKIIDGDLAHDVYHTFMDLYDAGESIETVKATVEQFRANNDDVDDEIFITAYALALWEIGQLDEKTLSQVAFTIQRGAFSNYLTQSEDAPSESRKRQQVLNRFWTKISQPNIRIRKRKDNKAPASFIFNVGDILAFQMPDGTYRATILLLVVQHRSRCIYEFAKPTYTNPTKPLLADIKNGELMGMSLAPGNRLGFDVVGIEHKHLRVIADKFELIGHLDINSLAQCCGSQTGAVDFESFASSFSDFNSFLDVKMTARTHPKKVFSVQKLLQ